MSLEEPLILCVDDQSDQLALTRKVLELLPCHFLLTDNADEALKIVKNNAIDLLLTDLCLPRSLELLESVRTKLPNAEVIIFTEPGDDIELVAQAVQKRAVDIVTKPLALPDLRIRVERALQMSSLKKENFLLKEAVRSRKGPKEILGFSVTAKRLREFIDRVCDSNEAVLIQGESGTGKEFVARALHENGPRSSEPFITLNCASFPASSIESELFGYKKGAETDQGRPGLMKIAGKGTLFLDELSELPYDSQSKFLQAIQKKEARPIDSHKPFKMQARILVATNRDLKQEVQAGRFREDLYHRLSILSLRIPALSERKEDIDILTQHFIEEANARGRRQVSGVSTEARYRFHEYEWPGNIRELRNTINRCMVLGEGPTIQLEELDFLIAAEERNSLDEISLLIKRRTPSLTLEEVQIKAIQEALELSHGHVKDAAKALDVSKSSLYSWIQKFNLKKISHSTASKK